MKIPKKIKSYTGFCLVVSSVLFISILLEGTGTGFPLPDRMGMGARAIAMGGAFTGVADDPTATYYNPAGLVQIDGHALQFEYIYQLPKITLNGSSYINKAVKAPMLALIVDPCRHWSIDRRVRIGMGVFFPDNVKSACKIRYGSDYDPWYPVYGDSTLQNFIAGQFVAAIEVFPWLYIGGGFLLNLCGYDIDIQMGLSSDTLVDMLSGEVEIPIHAYWQRSKLKWRFSIETRGIFGILLKPLPKLRVGFTYRREQLNPFEGGINIKGSLVIKELDLAIPLSTIPLLNLVFPLNVLAMCDFTPSQYALGASYHLRENLLIAFDVTCYDWRSYMDDAGFEPAVRFKEVYIPRVGFEYYPIKNIAFRIGYGYESSPVVEQPQGTNIFTNYMDNDVHEFACGAGYTGYSLANKYPVEISCYYQYSYLISRSLTNVHLSQKLEPLLPLKYDSEGEIHSFGLGMKIIF